MIELPANPKPLPCPFCGGEASVFLDDSGTPRWVSCDADYCEAIGPSLPPNFQGTPEEAAAFVVEKWNTRFTQ